MKAQVQQMPQIQVLPTLDRVLVRRLPEHKSRGGIVIPEGSQEKKCLYARVLAVGPGRMVDGTFVEPRVKVGQDVLLVAYAGSKVETQDRQENLSIVQESEILAIVEGIDHTLTGLED